MEFKQAYNDFFLQLDENYFDEDRFVPAVGPEDADFVLIGEAPGANEVEEGEPFVGRAGERLNEMLREVGVKRSNLYITNLVKIRPPDNRDPRRDEIDAWIPLLEREMERVDPKVVLTLGNFASKELTGTSKGISEIHGKYYQTDGLKVMPVYHPAATLYDRSKAPELKDDLRKAFEKTETGQQSLKDI